MLNFANHYSEVDFGVLGRLVARCRSLKVLKVNKYVTLEQLRRLLMHAPHLLDLGTGSFSQDQMLCTEAELESASASCKNLHSLSGVWGISSFLPALYPACSNLTFLNLSYAPLRSVELTNLLVHCPLLSRLWAHLALNDIDAAVDSFKKALELEPNDSGIKNQLAAAKKKIADRRDRERKAFARIFQMPAKSDANNEETH